MKLIYNSIFLDHDTGVDHPENADRLKYFEGYKETRIRSGEKYLKLAHSEMYVSKVRDACQNNYFMDPDTPTGPKSFDVACKAVGATIKASKKKAFAIVRPPGHHAYSSSGMGFCLFNNIAIAAKRLLRKGKRVAIFDFDIHHGNGTEEILQGEKEALFISIHQTPCYPGTGLVSKENSVNIPLNICADDHTYIEMLDSVKKHLERFSPDIVGVSAGFDSYHKDYQFMNDHVGFKLTNKSLEHIIKILEPYKHFMVLEGGYNPESIKDGVAVFSDDYNKFLKNKGW